MQKEPQDEGTDEEGKKWIVVRMESPHRKWINGRERERG